MCRRDTLRPQGSPRRAPRPPRRLRRHRTDRDDHGRHQFDDRTDNHPRRNDHRRFVAAADHRTPRTRRERRRRDERDALRGRQREVSIAARDAGELRFEGWVQTDELSVDWGDATASPSFDRVVQTLPPYYVWDPVESRVTLSAPVTVSENATPGAYTANVTVWHDLSHSHENGSTVSVTITVRNETACA